MIFDREQNHDIRSFDFVLGGADKLPLANRLWYPSLPVLDQGSIGACTGFGAASVAAAMPGLSWTNRHRLCRDATAISLYVLATNWDKFRGQYPASDTGSDVNSALKALRNLGWVGLYQWLTDARSVAGAISNIGPVQFGTTWFNSMMDTKPVDGYAKLIVDTNSGGDDQGHSYAGIGVNADRHTVVIKNSWGEEDWGAKGLAEITFDDLDVLLDLEGDAVLPQVNKTFSGDDGLV